MHNAPDVRGPTDPHHLSSTPQGSVPGSVPQARSSPETKPRRRLTAQQVDELTRLKPFLEHMTRQARMEYLMDDLVQSAVLQLVRRPGRTPTSSWTGRTAAAPSPAR